jgi:hypothetical protein
MTIGQMCFAIAWSAPPLAFLAWVVRQRPYGFLPILLITLWLSPLYLALGVQIVARKGLWKSWIIQAGLILPFAVILLVLLGFSCAGIVRILAAGVRITSESGLLSVRSQLLVLSLWFLCAIGITYLLGYGFLSLMGSIIPRCCPSCGQRRLVHCLTVHTPIGYTLVIYACLRCEMRFSLTRGDSKSAPILEPLSLDPIQWHES